MPTAHRSGPYRFFFYAGDGDEPPHVHVERNASEAKFWLTPVRLARNHGFSEKELNRICAIVQEQLDPLLERWNEFFEE
ncbi:MAG: DUF4160 domain-containing protein [Gemmataceae bacterium]|nr:DUF4160 domain-containing protein [Gemmataceae bacterium]